MPIRQVKRSCCFLVMMMLLGCETEKKSLRSEAEDVRVDQSGLIWMCVTNRPIPEVIHLLNVEFKRRGAKMSPIKIEHIGNWEGYYKRTKNKENDPFSSSTEWVRSSKMPRITIQAQGEPLRSVFEQMKEQARPYFDFLILEDQHPVVIALPYSE